MSHNLTLNFKDWKNNTLGCNIIAELWKDNFDQGTLNNVIISNDLLSLEAEYPTIHTDSIKTSYNANSTNVTVDAPENLAEGDLILMFVSGRRQTSITPPTGFTLLRFEGDTSSNWRAFNAIYYKIATSSEPSDYSFTLSVSSYGKRVTAVRVSGHNGIELDNGNNSGSGTSLSYAIPEISPTFPFCTLFSFITYYNTNITIGLPDDTIELLKNESDSLSANAAVYEQIGAGDTGTRIFTSSSWSRSSGIMFNVKGNIESSGYYISAPTNLSSYGITNPVFRIKWISEEPEDTTLVIQTAITDSNAIQPEEGDWNIQTPDSLISLPADLTGKYLWIKLNFDATVEDTPYLTWLVVYEDENLPFAAVKFDFNDQITNVPENGQLQFSGIEPNNEGVVGPQQSTSSGQNTNLYGIEFQIENPITIESISVRKTTSGTHEEWIELWGYTDNFEEGVLLQRKVVTLDTTVETLIELDFHVPLGFDKYWIGRGNDTGAAFRVAYSYSYPDEYPNLGITVLGSKIKYSTSIHTSWWFFAFNIQVKSFYTYDTYTMSLNSTPHEYAYFNKNGFFVKDEDVITTALISSNPAKVTQQYMEIAGQDTGEDSPVRVTKQYLEIAYSTISYNVTFNVKDVNGNVLGANTPINFFKHEIEENSLEEENVEFSSNGGSLNHEPPVWHQDDIKTVYNTNLNDVVVDKPDNLAEGDLIIAFVRGRYQSSITPPEGFTLIRHETDNNTLRSFVAAYYKIATGVEPANYTFNFATSSYAKRITLGRVTNYNTTSPIEKNNGTNSGSSYINPITIPSITSGGNSLLFGVVSVYGGTTITIPSSMTAIATNGNDSSSGNVVAYEEIGIGATGDKEFSFASWTYRTAGLMFNVNGIPTNPTGKILLEPKNLSIYGTTNPDLKLTWQGSESENTKIKVETAIIDDSKTFHENEQIGIGDGEQEIFYTEHEPDETEPIIVKINGTPVSSDYYIRNGKEIKFFDPNPNFYIIDTVGEFIWEVPTEEITQLSAFLVAGGGSGGYTGAHSPAGGGGGGEVDVFKGISISETGSSIPVIIGDGGKGTSTTVENGQDTIFAGRTVKGGGFGGGANGPGNDGGSGGGAGRGGTKGISIASGHGNDGGISEPGGSWNTGTGGAGGGGSREEGHSTNPNSGTIGMPGGEGISPEFLGFSENNIIYGSGGGGGARQNSGGSGGDGAGDGGNDNVHGHNALPNRGGGGGGGGSSGGIYGGGDGGSGIAIIKDTTNLPNNGDIITVDYTSIDTPEELDWNEQQNFETIIGLNQNLINKNLYIRITLESLNSIDVPSISWFVIYNNITNPLAISKVLFNEKIKEIDSSGQVIFTEVKDGIYLPYTVYTLSLPSSPYKLKLETEGFDVNIIYEDIIHDITIFSRKILSITTGNACSYIIKEDGTSWAAGYNRNSELGAGTEWIGIENIENFIFRPTDVLVKQIFTYWNASIALDMDNKLWGWGENYYGTVGNTTDWDEEYRNEIEDLSYRVVAYPRPVKFPTFNTWIPTQLGTDTWKRVIMNRAGWSENRQGAMWGIKTDGTMWSWGRNTGQNYNGGILGLLENTNGCARVVDIPTQIGTDSDWKDIGVWNRNRILFALKTDGSLWAWATINWSFNDYENSGIPIQMFTEFPSEWNKMSVGTEFMLLIKNDGTLWAVGINSSGQLGLGEEEGEEEGHKWIPTQVGTDSDWEEIYASFSSAWAKKSNGTWWAWGGNYDGQLGFGHDDWKVYIPTQLPFSDIKEIKFYWLNSSKNVFMIKTDGSLWAWGYHSLEHLDFEKDENPLIPIQIHPDNDWVSLIGGDYDRWGRINELPFMGIKKQTPSKFVRMPVVTIHNRKNPTITTSDILYSDWTSGYGHIATDWQIWNHNETELLWESLNNTENLTEIVANVILNIEENYVFKAKHHSESYGISNWGKTTHGWFITDPIPTHEWIDEETFLIKLISQYTIASGHDCILNATDWQIWNHNETELLWESLNNTEDLEEIIINFEIEEETWYRLKTRHYSIECGNTGWGTHLFAIGHVFRLWMFIDESNPVYNPSGYTNWNNDLAQYDTLPDLLTGPGPVINLCGVLSGGIGTPPESLLPVGEEFPSYVNYQSHQRPPILQELKNQWEADPHELVIMRYDTSGSLTLPQIQPSVGEFITWLQVEKGVTVLDFGSIGQDNPCGVEQWLCDAYHVIIEYLEDIEGIEF